MRSKPATKRPVTPDSVYDHVSVTRLVNRVMRDGKKSIARKQVYRTFDLLKQKSGQEPLPLFFQAMENIKPQMEVRPRRIGGAAYQVPTPVRTERKESLAIRWLLAAANSRSSSEYHSFSAKLAAEIIDAAAGNGAAVKKKLDTHRMAEANKAFAHFRW